MEQTVDMQTTGGGTAAEASRRHFDRWAAVYSRSRVLASLQSKALADLDLRGDDRLLDVACGAGKLVRAVAPDVQRAVGADLSPAMIDEARRRTEREDPPGSERIEFAVAPSDDLPFGDGEFTAVLTSTAFHHFPDPAASVREMARVVAPGGRLVIADFCRNRPSAKVVDAIQRRVESGHVGLRTTKEIEQLLVDAGLEVTRARRVWLGLYTLVTGAKAGDRP